MQRAVFLLTWFAAFTVVTFASADDHEAVFCGTLMSTIHTGSSPQGTSWTFLTLGCTTLAGRSRRDVLGNLRPVSLRNVLRFGGPRIVWGSRRTIPVIRVTKAL